MAHFPRIQPRRRRSRRSGLTLLELIVAVVIIAVVLVPMADSVARATASFARLREGMEGHDYAHRIMNVLISERLPTFTGLDALDEAAGAVEGGGSAILAEDGNYLEFLEAIGADMSLYSERDIEAFRKWEYSWTKELVVINKEGLFEPYEDGSGPNFGDPLEYEEMLREAERNDEVIDGVAPEELEALPAARLIRVKLILWVPGRRQFDNEYERERMGLSYDDPIDRENGSDSNTGRSQPGRNEATDPNKIVLMTYVDLDDFKESAANTDPTPDADGTQPTDPTGGTSGN